MRSVDYPLAGDAFARMLARCGHRVLECRGVTWFEYNHFLRPAYLPHLVPLITRADARSALKESGCAFARWDSEFGRVVDHGWWYVLREGDYELLQLSGNTRSKVRRGAKRLQARRATPDEIEGQGMRVCQLAVARYGNQGFLPEASHLRRKVEAAREFPDAFEFFGVFDGPELVGFSENQIQQDAVFWESIWYDPDRLRDYSSYLLTHAMLDLYLNERGMRYCLDGSRSLYHDTNVQTFLIEKFGFERRPARMHLAYQPWLRAAVMAAWPSRRLIERADEKLGLDVTAKMLGVLQQEAIARRCREPRGSP